MRIRSIKKIKPTAKSYRPPSVTFACWLVFFQGLGFLGAGLLRFLVYNQGDDQIAQGWFLLLTIGSQDRVALLFSAFLWSGLGVLALASALALWRLHSWAWAAGMTLQMMALISALVSYLRGSPNYLAMLFGVVIVFSLNQFEVQDTFRK